MTLLARLTDPRGAAGPRAGGHHNGRWRAAKTAVFAARGTPGRIRTCDPPVKSSLDPRPPRGVCGRVEFKSWHTKAREVASGCCQPPRLLSGLLSGGRDRVVTGAHRRHRGPRLAFQAPPLGCVDAIDACTARSGTQHAASVAASHAGARPSGPRRGRRLRTGGHGCSVAAERRPARPGPPELRGAPGPPRGLARPAPPGRHGAHRCADAAMRATSADARPAAIARSSRASTSASRTDRPPTEAPSAPSE